MKTCVKCEKEAQLAVTVDCGDTYCFLCLKGQLLTLDKKCKSCSSDIKMDINNISRDFHSVLTNLYGKHVWLYGSNSGDGWWMFDPKTTDLIETQYREGRPMCSYVIGPTTYHLSFGNDEGDQSSESVTSTTGKHRKVRRVILDKAMVKSINIKGISGVFFKKIEDEIGKFML